MLKKIGPKIQLPVMMLLWGLVSTCQSQVKSYGGLLACRFFLGLLEGGLFPGLVLYLSGFYRPHELQIRVGLFFCAAALSGAFSGLLAAAIENMEGLRGMHGWQVWDSTNQSKESWLTACSGSSYWKAFSLSSSRSSPSGSYPTPPSM